MTDRVPLAEQLDELAAEYTRRCRAYPVLVARGEMRHTAAELKIERMAAAHNTLAWLHRHADSIKEWMIYMQKVTPPAGLAELHADLPPDLDPSPEVDASDAVPEGEPILADEFET
jgi:hypothetical protein